MSQKGRLRRLDAGVRWLETEGMYIYIEGMMKSLEMLLDIADRADADPAFAARWKETFPSIVLPPPRRTQAPPQPKPAFVPPPECAPEPAPDRAPVIVPETPQSLQVQPPPPVMQARPPPLPPPRPPEPMPGMPVSPPSPDMEIRPVRWRQRGPQDYYDEDEEEEEVDGTNGRCLTEYDVLRDYDDDDD